MLLGDYCRKKKNSKFVIPKPRGVSGLNVKTKILELQNKFSSH